MNHPIGLDYRFYLIGLAIGAAVTIGIWLLFRRPMLWYFRINEMIALQERTVAALERMAGSKEPEKRGDLSHLYPGWVCRKCGADNPAGAEMCNLCHADRKTYG